MKTSIFPFALPALLVFQGCGSVYVEREQEQEHTEQTKALVSKLDLKATRSQCKVDVRYFQVQTCSGKHDDSINAVLEQKIDELINEEHCATEETTVTGDATVFFNEQGLLSVAYKVNSVSPTLPVDIHTIREFNFDLETGKRLKLSEVVDAVGVKMLVDACAATWAGSHWDFCITSEAFSLDALGIRYREQALPMAFIQSSLAGVVVPYKDLLPHIIHPRVRAVAERSMQ